MDAPNVYLLSNVLVTARIIITRANKTDLPSVNAIVGPGKLINKSSIIKTD